jgi:hypothetical protein
LIFNIFWIRFRRYVPAGLFYTGKSGLKNHLSVRISNGIIRFWKSGIFALEKSCNESDAPGGASSCTDKAEGVFKNTLLLRVFRPEDRHRLPSA